MPEIFNIEKAAQISNIEKAVEIVVIGEANAGKTELVNRLCDEDFMYKQPNVINRGIRYTYNDIKCTYTDKTSLIIRLKFFEMPNLVPCQSDDSDYVYPSANIYLLCYDVSAQDGLQKLSDLLQIHLSSFSKEAKFILVGNNNDLAASNDKAHNSFSVPGLELTDRIITSAKDDKNIFELHGIIAQLAKAANDHVVDLNPNEIIHRQEHLDQSQEGGQSSNQFKFFNLTRSILATGILAGFTASTIIVTLACASFLMVNPLALGLTLGLLAIITVGSLIYTGIKAIDNYQNDTAFLS